MPNTIAQMNWIDSGVRCVFLFFWTCMHTFITIRREIFCRIPVFTRKPTKLREFSERFLALSVQNGDRWLLNQSMTSKQPSFLCQFSVDASTSQICLPFSLFTSLSYCEPELSLLLFISIFSVIFLMFGVRCALPCLFAFWHMPFSKKCHEITII